MHLFGFLLLAWTSGACEEAVDPLAGLAPRDAGPGPSDAATGPSGRLVVSSEAVDFGRVVRGTSRELSVSITLEGSDGAEVEIAPEAEVDPCPSGAPFCARLVAPAGGPADRLLLRRGETASVELRFEPSAVGEVAATLLLSTCPSPSCRAQVRLTGTGVESGVACSPSPLDLGPVEPGVTASAQVRCESTAHLTVGVRGWSMTSDGGGTLSAAPSRAAQLEPGEAVEIDVTFAPTTPGIALGVLRVETDQPSAASSFIEVPVRGIGGTPALEVTPTSLDFGEVALLAPARDAVRIRNVGPIPVELAQAIVEGPGASAFSVAARPTALLAPGEVVELEVEFRPQVEEPLTARLRLRAGAPTPVEVVVQLRGRGTTAPPCVVALEPPELDFGTIAATRALERAVLIRNEGREPCLLTGARVQGAAFRVGGDLRSTRVPPGRSIALPVELSSDLVGLHEGELLVGVADATMPSRRVPLRGRTALRVPLLAPNAIDFGRREVGCGAPAREVVLYADGMEPLTVDVALGPGTAPGFVLVEGPIQQRTVEAGGALSFRVALRPAAEPGPMTGTVVVDAAGAFGAERYVVALFAEGVAAGTPHVEVHRQSPPAVDVLVVADASVGMDLELGLLRDEIGVLFGVARRKLGGDVRVAVTTSDLLLERGRFVSAAPGAPSGAEGPPATRVITLDARPSPESLLRANLGFASGRGGSAAEESPLATGRLALSPELLLGHNVGFLRREATLGVLYVSDEPEQSPEPVAYYAAALAAAKGFRRPNAVQVGAIVAADGAGSCSSPNGTSSSGARTGELLRRFAGRFGSICSVDWAAMMADMAQFLLGLRESWLLEQIPRTQTLRVFVDGAEVPPQAAGITRWSFDPNTRAVRFAPLGLPEPGAEIRIEYSPYCEP